MTETAHIQKMVILETPTMSDWECHLFGLGNNGITWRPIKGQEPNAFWRLMQFLVLGHHWVKVEK